MQGRIVDPTGVAVTNNPVNFDIKIYTPTTGVAGSHCLLYEETQSLDMTNSAGAFVLQVGTGTRVGAGPTLRETFTNASVASFGALTCGVGTSYTPGAIDDRSIEMTVSFGAQNLALSPIPVKAVPYAFQANQIGGYGINNLVRLNGAGSATNLDVDQFNYLTGFFNDNGTSGNPADDFLNAQSLQIKNLAAPTLASDAANKSYVDTAVAGVSASLPALTSAKIWVGNSANVAVAVSMSGDATIDNTGKLTVTGLQGKAVTLTGLAASDTLMYNGTAWVNKNMSTCGAGQFLSFDGTNYSCATPTGVSPTGSALTSAQIWVGNAGNLAAPVAMSGDATMSNTGALTLATSGVTAGTYTKVTVDAKGRVTVGANPTTLAGYGITDAVQNAGGAPSVQEGLAAAIPAAGTAGRIYVATDTKLIYRDNGATWDGMGASGAVSSVGASAPLQSSGGTTPTISFTNQNANLVLAGPSSGGAAAPTFRSLVAADLPALTAATFWLGNASNGTAAVSMSGDATMASTGAVSVTGIQGKAVSATAPTSNQVLTWNSTNTDWEATTPAAPGTTISGGTTKVLSMFNAAGTNVINSTVTDNGATGVNFANSKIQFGGTLFAHVSGSTTNIFLGLGSGNTTTTGTYNSAVGTGGLQNNTSGGSNSAMGSGALSNNTTGSNNTAMGAQALQANTTGTSNSAVGQWALISNNGSANSAMGFWALKNNTTGSNNTAMGAQALSNNTTGTYNSAVGDGALGGNTTGNNNSAVGYHTGGNADPASTGNLFLGYNAGPAGLGVINNKLYIHNAVSDTPLIGGDFSAGFVQINNQVELPLTSTTPTPTAGYGRVYAKADGNLYYKNATTEYQIGGAGSGVTSIAATAPLAVSASTGAVTASLGLTSAHMYVGNASNLAADVAMSGDATIDNTGKVTVNALQGKAVSATAPTANQILQYNGSAWIPTTSTSLSSTLASTHIFVGNASNVATDVAMSGDATIAADGTLTLNTVPVAKGGTGVTSYATGSVPVSNGAGALTATVCPLGQTLVSAGGTGFGCGLQSASGSSLAAGDIWVGNASGIATAVAPIGDVTMTNAGSFKVTQLQGTAVSATAPTSGQVLQFNGTNWAPTTNSYQSATLNDALMWIGNSSNLAAPVAMSGDATLADTGALTLASSGVTAGTYTKVTVDAKGRVTVGANPTTLAGYGITDAVQNAGGAPSVQEGLAASIPAAGTAGRIYVATDTKLIYRDNGATWDGMGASGAVSSVGASAPLQSSGGTTPTISFTNQNANLVLAGPSSGGAAAPTFRSLVAADLPALTAATFWLGNASNGTAAVSMSGDATMASTGAVSVTGIQGKAVSATAPSANQILQYNGSAWIPTTSTSLSSTLASTHIFVGNASNVATDVAMSGDATISNTGALTLNTVPVAKGGTGVTSYATGSVPVSNGAGALTATVCPLGQTLVSAGGTGFGCGLQSASGSSLAAGNIWVGNASGIATAVAPSGDVTMTNAGAFKVTQLQGTAVSATAPSVANQVLTWNGTNWGPGTGGLTGGTTSYVTKWSSATAVTSSVIYDDGTNIAVGTTTPSAMINAHGGAIVSDTVGNLAAVTNIIFSTGNVQTSANTTNNAAFKICGMKDGGSYTLVLTGQPVNSIPTFTAYSDAACSTSIANFDSAGVVLKTTSATTIITFIRAGNTVYAMLATGFTL